MLPALACAQLCAAVYTDVDGWDHRWVDNDIVVAHKRVGDMDVIVCRGSQSAIDWRRDLEAIPVHHEQLGTVHAGFVYGMNYVLTEITPLLKGKIVLTGHSLGAARTMILAGLLSKLTPTPPNQVTVFGCPRPGGEELRDIVCLSGAKVESYRNERDPVTYVPCLPGVFCHVVEPFQLNGGADPHDLTIFREHHIGRYITGLNQLIGVAA